MSAPAFSETDFTEDLRASSVPTLVLPGERRPDQRRLGEFIES